MLKNDALPAKCEKRSFFPLFCDVRGKTFLIVGGGEIAKRRVRTLLLFDCRIKVVSPVFAEDFPRDADIEIIARRFESNDLDGVFAVIAATDDRALNRKITETAKERGIFASAADCKEECSFYFPAVAAADGYTVGGVSTNGDHAGLKTAMRRIREVLNDSVGQPKQ